MKDLALTLAAPLSLIVVLVGIGLLMGAEPWLVAKTTAIVLPIAAYVVFSIFTVIWAIKIGEVGIRQEMTLQSRIYFWHGVSVVLVIVLSAAGSFVLLFLTQLMGLLHGLS